MASRTRKNVGVLGLGIIGQRVVSNLREHGFHVFVWNRTPRPVPNFVGSPAEVAELCDFIQIFVSDDDALLEMMQRMMPNLTAHHVVMAHCTVSPDTMRAAAEMAERRGAQLLDCPFTGSKNAAEKGELVYYVGGDEVAMSRARPVLEASSKEIIEIGKIGDATTIKVATNMITAASVQAAAEALALVSKSGLPAEKFAAAMKNNGSNSATLDMKLPMMMEGNFEPHFSVKHMLKDVVIATRLARGFGIEFGATDASRHGLTEEMRQGRGDADYSSLFRQYFPPGAPDEESSNGDEEQPRLAGLDESNPAGSAPLPVAVETAAEVPSEAKAMGEVVQAPAPTPPPEEPVVTAEVAGADRATPPAAGSLTALETPPAKEPAIAESAPAQVPAFAEAAPAKIPAVAEVASPKEPAAAEPAPAKEPAVAEVPAAKEPAVAESASAKEPAVAEPAPAKEPAFAEAASTKEHEIAEAALAKESAIAEPVPAKEPAVTEAAPNEDPLLKFRAPVKEDEGEEPRGLWGGFWRRRTDD